MTLKMKTLKSYPSENPRVWGLPPWPSLGCFENPDLPWALSVSAFHPPSPPLPSAVRLCHLCPEGLLCSWTKDCGAWRPYCLESDCLTPNTAKACPHEKMAHQKAWSGSAAGQELQSSPLDTASPGQHISFFLLSPGHLVCGLFGIKALFGVV